jgi:hypothetical protein
MGMDPFVLDQNFASGYLLPVDVGDIQKEEKDLLELDLENQAGGRSSCWIESEWI